MSKSRKRVAVVHQSLWAMRGAERLLKTSLEVLPDADIYILFGSRALLSKKFPGRRVKVSWLNRLPFIKKYYRITMPLWPFIYRSWDFSKYDLVVSFSSAFAKGITAKRHISVIMTSPRYLWDLSRWYVEAAPLWRRPFMWVLYTPLRIWDVYSSQFAHKVVAISEFVAKRYKKYYGREVDGVIYPPVDLSRCKVGEDRADYYLAVSPFEEHKRGDLMIEIAQAMGFKLKIIGEGNLSGRYKRMIDSSEGAIEILGWVSEKEKYDLLSKAKGLLYLGVEDFGIVPVEAIASGCPVLAYRKGGVLETVQDEISGIFLDDLTMDSIREGLVKMERVEWDRKAMRKSVMKFSKKNYLTNFADLLEQ